MCARAHIYVCVYVYVSATFLMKLHFSYKKHSDGERIARSTSLFSSTTFNIFLPRLHPCMSGYFFRAHLLLSLPVSLLSFLCSVIPISFPLPPSLRLVFGVGIYSIEKPQSPGESCSAGWKLATEPMNRFFQRRLEG